MEEDTIKAIFQSIVDGDQRVTAEKVQQALDAGAYPLEILNQGLVAGMEEVGRLYEACTYFIPELVISGLAMKVGMKYLKPALVKAGVKPCGKVVIGTVPGELHTLGKDLVSMLLEGASFEVIDLGSDVAPESFVDSVRTTQPQIMALSAQLTSTLPNLQIIIQALEDAGLREKVKVIVGGAALTQAYADQIGADGYAPNANQAVALARSFVPISDCL